MVGWRSNAAADALELIPACSRIRLSIRAQLSIGGSCSGGLPDRPGTPRIRANLGFDRAHVEVRGSPELCNRLRWRLCCRFDPITDAFEVFDGNRRRAAFGVENDCFAQHVVGVALEACLLTASAPERARLLERVPTFCAGARRRECWRRRTSSICAPL